MAFEQTKNAVVFLGSSEGTATSGIRFLKRPEQTAKQCFFSFFSQNRFFMARSPGGFRVSHARIA